MKKRAVAFVIVLFLLVACSILYIFSELYTEEEITEKKKETEVVQTDASKFKEEYESLNGSTFEKDGVTYTVRSVSIDEDNPFVYSSAEEIVKKIENKESFVVYFGFAECPWCRSVLETAIEEAKAKNVTTIYYVDLTDIRDTYELNDDHEAVRTKEGTEAYYKLLELLDNVLDDYSPLTYTNSKGKEKEVKVDEKRIYAPNYIIVKNGEGIALEEGISSMQTDAYQDLDDGIKCDMKEKFDCFFDQAVEESYTCSTETKC